MAGARMAITRPRVTALGWPIGVNGIGIVSTRPGIWFARRRSSGHPGRLSRECKFCGRPSVVIV